MLIGLATFTLIVKEGLGLAGYQPPVFWVGLHHDLRLLGRHRPRRHPEISAILFLFRSPWRTAVYRATESDDGVRGHDGGALPDHPHRAPVDLLLLLPYPNQRYLWPNFKSPLVWDVFAISTYFTVSSCFLIFGLIPDRPRRWRDKATGWRRSSTPCSR